jgi:predicted nucleic acid-binding protein
VSFLLDTNVVSEWVKPRPNPGVVTWLAGAEEDQTFLSAVTLAELHYGAERIPDGRRRKQLEGWLRNDVPERFAGRILPIDERVAEAWGTLMARREAAGRPLGVVDGFIAATATVHGLTLVTRNTTDFAPSLRGLLNPWDAA